MLVVALDGPSKRGIGRMAGRRCGHGRFLFNNAMMGQRDAVSVFLMDVTPFVRFDCCLPPKSSALTVAESG